MNLKSDLATKLREVLDNMTQEEFDKEWSEITALNLESPSFSEVIEYFALMKDQLGHFEMTSTPQFGVSVSNNYALAA